jgi:hypothetical protein
MRLPKLRKVTQLEEVYGRPSGLFLLCTEIREGVGLSSYHFLFMYLAGPMEKSISFHNLLISGEPRWLSHSLERWSQVLMLSGICGHRSDCHEGRWSQIHRIRGTVLRATQEAPSLVRR